MGMIGEESPLSIMRGRKCIRPLQSERTKIEMTCVDDAKEGSVLRGWIVVNVEGVGSFSHLVRRFWL